MAHPTTGNSRRDFLRKSLLLGTGMVVNSSVAGILDLAPSAVKSLRSIDEGITDMRANEQKQPIYSQTAIESHFVMIGKLISAAIVERYLGADRVGNASIDDEAEKKALLEHPFDLWFKGVAIAPYAEEIIFRAFPAKIIGTGWDVGIASSLIFAGAHNLGAKEFKIPLTQFIGGIYYWYLVKHRGFSHAILAHAFNNNIAYIYEYLDLHLSQPKSQCLKFYSPR
jgi:hypothetical protein